MNRYPVARILKDFGIKGELKVKVYFSPPEYFKNYKKVSIYTNEFGFIDYEVDYFKILKGHYGILKFKDIHDLQVLKKLKGLEIYIDENLLPPKENGEYYVYELENLRVYYEGQEIGYIEDIILQNNYTLFKIRTQDDELYIPFNKKFIKCIDLENKICYLNEKILNF
ncbi:MAG: ribosome maturation factor RimM [candidate division WOR-3 bacterium]|nr:ribosome maturation factor RimM [candidate division WOR-3 bacterium]MDW8151250.1 ribosome maturation factor RimM [candidate division WOR-3 bacterium]